MEYKYKIEFLKDDKGFSESEMYILELNKKSLKSKDARIKVNKITEYFRALREYGTIIGVPAVKHIYDELYELRPLQDRFFFFYRHENKYVILNHFVKKSQKTPIKEIEKAFRLIENYKRKENNNEI
ncbi:MAG: type II toxin-antitoxin system RelE/ParE family toxin [Candidatus Gastranaerophilaceae bacterium]